jgi:ferredoxin
MLFAYELFDLWSTPLWTAWLMVAYFAGALLVDSLFRGATFCKYLCPLGQFNFLSSLVSPFEVRVRRLETCEACRTKDCIKGRGGSRTPSGAGTGSGATGIVRGCELWLFQPGKVGNMDCTFCLDCARACPHDNVGILPRLPASELWVDARRSGIGRFSRRPDLAALATLFCFGALLNAFAMVTPVYGVEEWLAGLLGTASEAPVLVVLFLTGLLLLPAALMGLTGWLSWRSVRSTIGGTLMTWVTRMAFALVPLGFGVWLAHYSFHLLTGFWTFVPVLQSFVSDIAGSPLLGAPRWYLGPLVPDALLYPVELGFLGLGWLGSLLVAYRLAGGDSQRRHRATVPLRALLPWAMLPWAALVTLLLAAAVWLMAQPMEMRGTFLAG